MFDFSRHETYRNSLSALDKFRTVQLVPDSKYCLSGNEPDVSLTNYSNHFLCFKSNSYHVPDFCNVPHGSPITKRHFSSVPRQTLIKGLAVQSLDCTFTLAINISKHFDWINSVVIGSSITEADDGKIFNFRDTDLVPGDACIQHNRVQGVCKSKKECKKKVSGPMLLCVGDAVCC